MNLMVQINIIMYQKNKEDGSTNIAKLTLVYCYSPRRLLSSFSMALPPITRKIIQNTISASNVVMLLNFNYLD